MDRAGLPSTPLEPPPALAPSRPLGFAAGLAIGVTLAAIAAQAWMAVHLAPLRATFRDFEAPLRNLSALALTPAWRWGAPLVHGAIVAGLLAARVRRPWIYALVAALAIATLVATYLWAIAPLTEMTSRIAG
jgi:hypothetical protein